MGMHGPGGPRGPRGMMGKKEKRSRPIRVLLGKMVYYLGNFKRIVVKTIENTAVPLRQSICSGSRCPYSNVSNSISDAVAIR